MPNLRSILLLAPLALVSAPGCTVSHGLDAPPEGPTFSDAGPTFSDAAAGGSYCASICATPTTSCGTEFDVWDWPSTCEERCASLSGSPPATRAAFERCLLTEPLCYEDLAGCILRYRYREPVQMPFSLVVEGLDEHEGRVVEVWRQLEGELVTHRARVVDGAFEARWSELQHPNQFVPVWAMVHIDVDGDGICDPEIDLAGTVPLRLSGTFDAPEYTAALEGPPDPGVGSFWSLCDG